MRLAHITAKCSDCCFIKMGEREHDGYVPGDLGVGGGDYVELTLCLQCGHVDGEWPLAESELEAK